MGAHAVEGSLMCLPTSFVHELQLGWHPADSRPTARMKNVKVSTYLMRIIKMR